MTVTLIPIQYCSRVYTQTHLFFDNKHEVDNEMKAGQATILVWSGVQVSY